MSILVLDRVQTVPGSSLKHGKSVFKNRDRKTTCGLPGAKIAPSLPPLVPCVLFLFCVPGALASCGAVVSCVFVGVSLFGHSFFVLCVLCVLVCFLCLRLWLALC